MSSVRQILRIVGLCFFRQTSQFEQAAVPRGFIVHSESVAQERDLIPALERLLARSDVLIAIPDSVVHNRSTVQPLLMTTYRAGVPVIGFSESYSLAGAVASLHSSPDQIGRQVAEVVSGALKGRFSPGILGPRYFRVTTNSTVARSLGITVPGGAVLEERIEAVEREAPAP